MSIFTSNRKSMDSVRYTSTTSIKAALDLLKEKGGTDEDREALVDSTMELLDQHIKLEDQNSRLEYCNGRLDGHVWCAASIVLGFIVGKGIEYLKNKNT